MLGYDEADVDWLPSAEAESLATADAAPGRMKDFSLWSVGLDSIMNVSYDSLCPSACQTALLGGDVGCALRRAVGFALHRSKVQAVGSTECSVA